jgi:nucleoside-diphosphate-sugar epimerase
MKNKIYPLRILITGASGFIGKHLLEKLLKISDLIACVDLFFDQTFIERYGERVQLFLGNILDKSFIASCIQNFLPDYVFHFAGSKNRTNSLPEFKSSYEINYMGTLNLFEALLKNQNLKLVTILGTIEEYGHTCSPFKEDSHELPNSAYGLSKLSATKLALIFNRQFNFPVVVLRPSIAYGPAQGEEMFIPALIKTLLRKEPFKMTEGNQLRDFIYIDDLTDALLKGINCRGLEGHIINIASGISIKIRDIALQIAEMTNNRENLKIGEVPYRSTEIMDYTVDISKASTLLHWYPLTILSDGLQKTIAFYKKNLCDEA